MKDLKVESKDEHNKQGCELAGPIFLHSINDLQDQMPAVGVAKTPKDLAQRCLQTLLAKIQLL